MDPPLRSSSGSGPAIGERLNHVHHITQAPFLREPLPVVDAQNLHALVVLQVRKKFGSDEEVLGTVVLACDFDHVVMNHPFSALVHALGKKVPC